MSLESYQDWLSIFDEDLAKVWTSLMDKKELQKISMVLFAVKKEFQKVTDELDKDLVNLKQKLNQRNRLQNKERYPLSLSNLSPPELTKMKKDHGTLETYNDSHKTADSPDLFYSQKQSSTSSDGENNTSLIVSEEDDFKLGNSPIIKRRRKVSKLKENHRHLTPSLCFDLDIVGVAQVDKPKDKQSFTNPQIETPTVRKNKMSSQNPFKTPQQIRLSSDFDCSVIANTPEVELKKPKANISKGSLLYMSKKKSSRKNNSTLTQMFSSESSKSKIKNNTNRKKIVEETSDCDITNCDDNIYKDITKMSISEMVNFINEDSKSKETEESFTTKKTDISEDHLDTKMSDPLAEGLNEYLAKVNNIPGNAVPGPVVRGKARKELPSWSCKECERFYINQDLSIAEIEMLSKNCSKHRGITKPRDDTVPGFWDITMTTQESQE